MPMTAARNLSKRVAGDYAIMPCDICKFDLCRSDGTEEYSEKNWLRTCASCDERCCRDCLPPGDTRCKTCRARAAERQVPLEVADSPLFGGELRGDEPLPPAPDAFRILDDPEDE